VEIIEIMPPAVKTDMTADLAISQDMAIDGVFRASDFDQQPWLCNRT
jgi:hypothetical protein